MKALVSIICTFTAMSVAAITAPPEKVWEPLGVYEVTAYSYSEGGGENYKTASGAVPVPYSTVAATSDIPYGTVLYIEGVGEVVVQDRGRISRGVIDLHIGHDNPAKWGRKKLKVWRETNEIRRTENK